MFHKSQWLFLGCSSITYIILITYILLQSYEITEFTNLRESLINSFELPKRGKTQQQNR